MPSPVEVKSVPAEQVAARAGEDTFANPTAAIKVAIDRPRLILLIKLLLICDLQLIESG